MKIYSLKEKVGTQHKALKGPVSDLERLSWKDLIAKYDHWTMRQWIIATLNQSSNFLKKSKDSMLDVGLV